MQPIHQLEPPITRRAAVLDALAFFGSLIIAWYFGWSTGDLIWSFWFTSLAMGFTMAFVGYGAPLLRPDKHPVERTLSLAGGLFSLAFFTFHFGMFHYVYASMLDLFFPLLPQPDRVYVGNLTWRGTVPATIPDILRVTASNYWMFALINILHDSRMVFTPIQPLNSIQPYRSMLKLHFLMFALGALYAVGFDSFPVFAFVLFFFFTPVSVWRYFFRKRGTQPNGKGSAKTL